MGAVASWAANFLVGQFTPMIMDALHFRTFYVFACFDVACFCYASRIPETAGVHLEQLIPIFETRLRAKYIDDLS